MKVIKGRSNEFAFDVVPGAGANTIPGINSRFGLTRLCAQVGTPATVPCACRGGEGLAVGGVLPGSLQVPRKGQDYLRRAKAMNADVRRVGTLSAYALAVSEVNASGGRYHAAYGSGHVSYL